MGPLRAQGAGCSTTFARRESPQLHVAFTLTVDQLCSPENIKPVQELIDTIINEDTAYARQPLELRNQRTYAVKSGVNGLLDVARMTYKEALEDAYQHVTELGRELLPILLQSSN